MGKTAISMDDDLLTTSQELARAEGVSLSAWLADAARAKVRRQRAAAYGEWLTTQSPAERAESRTLDSLGAGNKDSSLRGAEW